MGVRIRGEEGDVLVVAIDRPEKLNAADPTVYHGLEAALEEEARAYVLTGSHGHFSAGDDVSMFSFKDLGEADAFIVKVTRLFQKIESVPKPVVAAVDGYALGFGFELALVCDVILATPQAIFGLKEITHGAAPPNAMGRGVDVLGRGWIRYLALMGRRWLTGLEAHDLGMVVELHPAERLVDEAVRVAEEMAGNPRFVAAKRLLNLHGEPAFRMAPMVMPRLMASPTVAESQRRYARVD